MGFLDIFKDKVQFTVRDPQLPSKIEQLLRKKIPNIKDSDLEKYLKRVKKDMEITSGKYSTSFMVGNSGDSPARRKSRGNKWDKTNADVYSDMSEDDIIDDFKYYTTPKSYGMDTITLEKLQMEETPKSTTKMKKSELKEMIKAAFLSEADFTNAQDDDAALGGMYDPVYEAEEEDLDEMLARLSEEEVEEGEDKVVDPYLAEAEDEEETDIDVDADIDVEKEDGGEEETANDSIVVDKKIVSLSSLPQDTRKILDTLETLRAQAEEFGDQKFITQVGNTITFFTRDFVVAGDEPTRAKVDESVAFPLWNRLNG